MLELLTSDKSTVKGVLVGVFTLKALPEGPHLARVTESRWTASKMAAAPGRLPAAGFAARPTSSATATSGPGPALFCALKSCESWDFLSLSFCLVLQDKKLVDL
ncbi:uncharacterized protein LOC144112611 [Amblyomma americanum]